MVGGVHRCSRGHISAPAHICQDSDLERAKKVVSKSKKHSIYTHFQKDRNCEVCSRTKMTRTPCRRRTGEAVPLAEKFGDLTMADHKVLKWDGESLNNHRYAVVVQDLAHSMDSIQSVQNEDFTRDGKEFTKVPRAITNVKSYFYGQLNGRSVMESPNFNTSSI